MRMWLVIMVLYIAIASGIALAGIYSAIMRIMYYANY